MSSISEIKDVMPDYAKDLKLNLSSLANNPGMTDQQVYGTALACAYASRNAKLLKAVAAYASGGREALKLQPGNSAKMLLEQLR